jgi:O-acetyl-ADP-ribose deacetylase (regulator of RNase III)
VAIFQDNCKIGRVSQLSLTLVYCHVKIKREVVMNRVLQEHVFPAGERLQLVEGDLTQEDVDAIVNAANAQLQHGGGVAGAIVRRGGKEIQTESNTWVRQHGPVSHAEPAYTGAGKLACRYIIHAVGPVWGEGDEDNKLAAAVNGTLELADRLKLSSIAFPAISTGIFGYPKERAAGVIFNSFKNYFEKEAPSDLKLIRLTLFDQPTIAAFLQVWNTIDFLSTF